MKVDYSGLKALLAEQGWSTYRIRKEGLLGQQTLTSIRAGREIGGVSIRRLCHVLKCQPGDIMRYVDEEGENVRRTEL